MVQLQGLVHVLHVVLDNTKLTLEVYPVQHANLALLEPGAAPLQEWLRALHVLLEHIMQGQVRQY